MEIMSFRLLLLLTTWPSLLFAQEPLTINAAMQQAVAHHPLILAAEARAGSARAQARQALGYRLPSVDVSETFVRTNNPAEAFALQMNQERFSMAEFGNPANDPNNPDLLNTYMTRAEATLPLVTGGLLHARTAQARSMARAADFDLERTRESVAFDAASAWLNLSKVREYRDLTSRALATAMAHRDKASEYFNQGMFAPGDVMRADVFVAELREYKARADEQEQLAQAALNFHLGRPQEQQIELSEYSEPEASNLASDDAVTRALNERPDLQSARAKLRAGKKEVMATRSAFLPQLGVVARYDFYDDELFGDNGESWAVMGQAKLNLFHGGADYHAQQKAVLDARAGEEDVKRFQEGVELEVRQALAERTGAMLRMEAASVALTSGREQLRVTEARYAQGVAQMTDLLDSQTALRELEMRELTARYDKLTSEYRLKFVTGQSILN
ncbi:TolC family protein [bacterium]|nr:TolC family protein [bacterium]